MLRRCVAEVHPPGHADFGCALADSLARVTPCHRTQTGIEAESAIKTPPRDIPLSIRSMPSCIQGQRAFGFTIVEFIALATMLFRIALVPAAGFESKAAQVSLMALPLIVLPDAGFPAKELFVKVAVLI